ncbi:MAG: MobC family plasmid mobilization relaxosome protein [Candidatus Thiodiazotropha sp. (ex Ctena orbiculata)]|nr:MobC family plasmid mobilization relaxosome protein [Candidatus Thiodiazotropha taylori]MBT2997399.1 MobC family plasmid mobilization relaxosome protein [Candidatus Thiodiazotropha taylori]MBT3001072.1 MobC family plasmid mobilization relaxosome protein [Candidatus Thiodiazotropha taylori]MBV2111920.1 MobC family plasmid mobilization relaxosome protein [Candidatus Thiodiazotropha taylori]
MTEKSPKDQRNKYPPPFSMRFTEDERKTLEMAAAGRPLAAYIRWLIFKEDMPEMPKKRTRGETADKDHKEMAKLLGALGQSRIASNINQLAKAANSGSLPVNKEVLQSLKDAVDSIKWMRDTLIKGMGLKPQSQEPKENSDDPEG